LRGIRAVKRKLSDAHFAPACSTDAVNVLAVPYPKMSKEAIEQSARDQAMEISAAPSPTPRCLTSRCRPPTFT